MGTPEVSARLWMIGTIVAAKGMLSTKALAIADTQRIMAIMSITLPPLISPMKFAMSLSMPVSSRPLTTIKSPTKNSRVL